MARTHVVEVPADDDIPYAADVTDDRPASPPPVHEDGIYFGLDAEKTYHRDLALGSGDIKRVLTSPPDYWWKSGMNPLRPADPDTTFKSFGRAVHVKVLEGAEKFARFYERVDTDPATLRTDVQLRAWLVQHGHKAPTTKAEKAKLIAALDPSVKIADLIAQRAAENGITILRAEEYGRIMISASMIAKKRDLGQAFVGGMPEVAMFYTETVDGHPVRCKALFDYLKIRGIVDLKSTSNPGELSFKQLCANRFSERRMDMQVAHYMRAREFIQRYVAEGRVFGDVDADWLKRVAEVEEYGFVHVFFQSSGAPSVASRTTSRGNPILEYAENDRAIALRNFADFHREFGAEMWMQDDPMSEWDINDLPGWWARRQL